MSNVEGKLKQTDTSNVDTKDKQHPQNMPPGNASGSITDTGEDLKQRKEKAHSNWSKIFRPWKWKRKKKSEKFTETASTLERKISVRSTRDDLVKKGLLPVSNETSDEVGLNVNNEPSASHSLESVKELHETNLANTVENDKQQNLTKSFDSGDGSRPVAMKPPAYLHKKFPSDEVSKTSNYSYRQHQHRHSYQIATSAEHDKVDNSLNSVNVSRFQMQNSGGNGLIAVGIVGNRPVPEVGNSNTIQQSSSTPPQPKARSSLGFKNQDYSEHERSSYSSAFAPEPSSRSTRPTSTSSSSSSQDLNRTSVGNAYSSANHDAKSASNENHNQPGVPANKENSLQRPVAAKRTMKNMPSVTNTTAVSQKGPPPKPPPKPTKHVNSQAMGVHHQGLPNANASVNSQIAQSMLYSQQNYRSHSSEVPPSQTLTEPRNSGVIFAPSADIIQKTTEMRIPHYLQHNNYEDTQKSLCNTFSQDYDSDSSGSVLYRDDDEDGGDEEDDDEENSNAGGLAAKVARRDTLALRLANRPNRDELEQRNIIPSPQRNDEIRTEVRKNLTRRLSQRPPKSELQERNILPNETAEDRHKEREKVKRQLTRKLSMRPTVKELIERKVLINWHEYVEVYEIQNYDRRGDKPWTRLTPTDKASIRKELNEYKANEMTVHEESKCYTRFHKP